MGSWSIGVGTAGCLWLVAGLSGLMENDERVLFDFADRAGVATWQTVNDGVMGGVSEGRFKFSDEGTLVFFGTLSLENNGGFASVRSRPGKLDLRPGDEIVIRIRGDGREYSLNLYVPRRQTAFSYRAPLPTKQGEWTEVRVPLGDFRATSFGRVVADAGPVDPAEVTSIGFLLGDKRAGPLQLEVDWIKSGRSAARSEAGGTR